MRQGHIEGCPACQLEELGDEYRAWFAANHYAPVHEYTTRAKRLIDTKPLAPPKPKPVPPSLPPLQGPQPVPMVDWKALRKASMLKRCERCRWYMRWAITAGKRERCRCGRWHSPRDRTATWS